MLTCSFCGKAASATSALLAGPEANICGECIAVGVRVIETRDALEEPMPDREDLEATKEDVLISQMAATSELVDRTRDRLQRQVGELRRRGLDWGVIGTAIGVSRQTAQERFG